MTVRDDLQVCRVQDALLDMTIGRTGVRFGVVVTRWAKDAFELDTLGIESGTGSETAAEEIVRRLPSRG